MNKLLWTASAPKHRLVHLASMIANGWRSAGTDWFWHDTGYSGSVTGGRANEQRNVNPCSVRAVGERSADHLQH